MMRFRDTDTFHGIEEKIKIALTENGLNGYLARDKQYMPSLWDNILVYMIACKYGVAVFEIIKEQDFNPNISLELGVMYAWGRNCLLLKDNNLPRLPTDICGSLYKDFDPDRLASITDAVRSWVKDNVELKA